MDTRAKPMQRPSPHGEPAGRDVMPIPVMASGLINRCDLSPRRRAVSWICQPGMLGPRCGSIQWESRNRNEDAPPYRRKGFGGRIEPKALHR